MPDLTNQTYLLNQQYNNAAKLNARLTIHSRFSSNPYGWFRWVFDQYNLPPHCRILELGCGTGETWRANLARIPEGWQITLSDFSDGMLAQARQNLAGLRPCTFERIDAQSIPGEVGRFDAVIANHMLYHVPDRPRALAEIRRVLKPGGRFYATTIGKKHMQEMYELPNRFAPDRVFDHLDHLRITDEFSLEDGATQLQAFFEQVRLERYPDSLHVTEAGPLVDYIFSTFEFGNGEDRRADFLKFIEEEIQQNGGAIEITKDSGMFIAA